MEYLAADITVNSTVAIQPQVDRVREDINLILVNKRCPLCDSWLEIVTHVHAEKHGMTRAEYMSKCFPTYNRKDWSRKAHNVGFSFVQKKENKDSLSFRGPKKIEGSDPQ